MKSLCFSFFWAAHLTALTSSHSSHCSCCNLTFMRCHFSLYYHLEWCWLPNPAHCLSFHATFSSKRILWMLFPRVCVHWVVLRFCVLGHLPLEVHAWMGGDLGVEQGHTKGITSPSWHGSAWGSPRCSYREVAGGKDKLVVKSAWLPPGTWPEYVAATCMNGWNNVPPRLHRYLSVFSYSNVSVLMICWCYWAIAINQPVMTSWETYKMLIFRHEDIRRETYLSTLGLENKGSSLVLHPGLSHHL